MLGKKNYSDSQLITMIKSGGSDREKANSYIWELHRKKFLSIASKKFSKLSLDQIEDCYDFALIVVDQQIREEKFEEKGSIAGFFYVIFTRKCLRAIRLLNQDPISGSLDLEPLINILDTAQQQEWNEDSVDLLLWLQASSLLHKLVIEAFAEINPACEPILKMTTQQLSQAEIAELTGRALGGIKVTLFKCRKDLVRLLLQKVATLTNSKLLDGERNNEQRLWTRLLIALMNLD